MEKEDCTTNYDVWARNIEIDSIKEMFQQSGLLSSWYVNYSDDGARSMVFKDILDAKPHSEEFIPKIIRRSSWKTNLDWGMLMGKNK